MTNVNKNRVAGAQPIPADAMPLDILRLECLKLAHTHAKGVPTILAEAEVYMAYVTSGKLPAGNTAPAK